MEAVRRFIVGDNNFEAETPWGGWSALFMSISFFVFQIIITIIIGMVLVITIHGSGVFRGEYAASDIASFINIGIISLFTGYILTYGLVLFVGILRGGTIGNALLLKRPENLLRNIVVGVIALALFFAAFSFVISTFFAHDSTQSEAQMKLIFETLRQSSFLWAGVAVIVIGAPFIEETIFRGFLLASLSKTRLGFWGGAVVSSAMWASMHGYAISMAGGLFVFGLLLSWMVRRTGSIWVSILLHAIWNGGVTAAMFAAMNT